MGVYKYNATDDELNPIAGATTYAENPIGSIIPFGGTTSPAGWLFCRGQELLRADYAELFEVIGTSFGAGDGSTTFNLPDLRNKTTVGGGTLGANSEGALPNIKSAKQNTLIAWATGSDITATSALYKIDTAYSGGVTSGSMGAWSSIGMDASRSNSLYKDNQSYVEPANVRVNYIIKAERVAAPADFVAAIPKYTTDKVDWRDYGRFGIANLLEITNTTTSSNGVNFTKNYDNSVTISSSNVTGDVTWYLSDAFTLPLGSYRLTGAATGSTSSGYRLRITKNGTVLPEVYTSSPSYEFEVTNTTDEYRVAIRIASSLTGSAIAETTFYPMLTHAEYTGEYAYAKTNLELTKSTQYSTEEIPVGTWIDGKTIYRKVFSGNFNSSAVADLDLTSLNIENIVNTEWIGWHNNGNAVQLPYYYSAADQGYWYYVTAGASGTTGHLYMRCGSLLASQKYTFVLEYTKTTS